MRECPIELSRGAITILRIKTPVTLFGTSMRQKTIENEVHCSGIGLHSGKEVSMSLHPAEADTGIIFRRLDVPDNRSKIPALFDQVIDTRLCTTLANDRGTSVATIEHLMAALAGCQIDNVIVTINGSEVPIMDGSAGPFVSLIECAGIVELDSPRNIIQILHEVSVNEGNGRAFLSPTSHQRSSLDINLNIDFDNAAIGYQTLLMSLSSWNFKQDICHARTFGFLEDVEALRQAGLAQGGSLDNAIVISENGILNEDGLRYDDEFVRHKALDCIGDLYLAGNQIAGCFSGYRTGHGIHNKLLRRLFADREAWRLVPVDESTEIRAPHWNVESQRAIA